MMGKHRGRRGRLVVWLFFLLVAISCLLFFSRLFSPWLHVRILSNSWRPQLSPHAFEDDVVLTFRTGSTVLYQRLPVHLLPLLDARESGEPWEYIPNRAFYSDAATSLGGVPIQDALRNISADVKALPDFSETYTQLQDLILGQDPAILINHIAASGNNAWLLDRWKILPLHGDAYRRWPDTKWHIAIEDDTFLMWNQLIKWLKTKPHDEQKFYGNPAVLVNGSIPFNHGGSGYVISRGLMRETYGRDPWGYEHKFNHFLRYSCCGDAELSRAFLLSKPDVKLEEPSWEEGQYSFRGEGLDKLPLTSSMWCEPFFTLHHVDAQAIVELQRFKRAVEPLVKDDDFVRWIDLWDYMRPHFLVVADSSIPRPDFIKRDRWTAIPVGAGQHVPELRSVDTCLRECEARQDCLVWTFDDDIGCRVSQGEVFLGRFDQNLPGLWSGWSLSRLAQLRSRLWCAGRLGDLGSLAYRYRSL